MNTKTYTSDLLLVGIVLSATAIPFARTISGGQPKAVLQQGDADCYMGKAN